MPFGPKAQEEIDRRLKCPLDTRSREGLALRQGSYGESPRPETHRAVVRDVL